MDKPVCSNSANKEPASDRRILHATTGQRTRATGELPLPDGATQRDLPQPGALPLEAECAL